MRGSTIPTHDGLPVTPLFDAHQQLGARMVEFGGWLMPVQYQSIIAEHEAVRSRAGAFDLSHMGRVHLQGRDRLALVQRIFTNDASVLGEGRAQYSLACSEDGGVLDDVIVYNLGSEMLVVVNASNREAMTEWMLHQRDQGGLDVGLDDRTGAVAMIGVQGPESETILQSFTNADLFTLPYYAVRRGNVVDQPALIARTGYTGEDGFEVMLPAEAAGVFWRALTQGHATVRPCGLGARDTLRLEAGMPLYGHEIDRTRTPYQAGLGRVVKLTKGDFVGREALERARERVDAPRLAAFRLADAGIARQGYEVQCAGRVIGQVTSGSPSPTLKVGIGMAYVMPEFASPGQRIEVMVRGRAAAAEIVKLPFVPHHTKKIPPAGSASVVSN